MIPASERSLMDRRDQGVAFLPGAQPQAGSRTLPCCLSITVALGALTSCALTNSPKTIISASPRSLACAAGTLKDLGYTIYYVSRDSMEMRGRRRAGNAAYPAATFRDEFVVIRRIGVTRLEVTTLVGVGGGGSGSERTEVLTPAAKQPMPVLDEQIAMIAAQCRAGTVQ